MGSSNWIHIYVDRIVQESNKAFLIAVDGGETEVWIPKSQISDWEQYNVGDANITISVTEFIAREKGLEEKE